MGSGRSDAEGRSQPSAKDYGKIEELIASEHSPVGIDAKKTQVIIQKLPRIEEQLVRLELLATGEDA